MYYTEMWTESFVSTEESRYLWFVASKAVSGRWNMWFKWLHKSKQREDANKYLSEKYFECDWIKGDIENKML